MDSRVSSNSAAHKNKTELSSMSYEDLEHKAAQMKIINMGEVNKRRKESIPQSIVNDKNYTFELLGYDFIID